MWYLSEDTTFQTRVESKSLGAMLYTQHITKSFWFYLLLISQHCLLLFNHFFPLPHLHCNPSYPQCSSMASYCLEDLYSKPFTIEPQHIFLDSSSSTLLPPYSIYASYSRLFTPMHNKVLWLFLHYSLIPEYSCPLCPSVQLYLFYKAQLKYHLDEFFLNLSFCPTIFSLPLFPLYQTSNWYCIILL